VLHLGDGASAVLRFSESSEAFRLDLVLVPSPRRGEGIGSELVGRLLQLADSSGKPVLVTARPIGRSDPETLRRLVTYYERHGFVVRQWSGTSALMRREPAAASPKRSGSHQ